MLEGIANSIYPVSETWTSNRVRIMHVNTLLVLAFHFQKLPMAGTLLLHLELSCCL